MPQAISISLDREGRSDELCDELSARSNGLIRFIPRRTYENYLIHAAAIAAVLKQQDGNCSVSPVEVEQWMDSHWNDARYYSSVARPCAEEQQGRWLERINAPRFLQDLIGTLTNNTQDFKSRKISYSLALTVWLVENDRDHLGELVEYVLKLFAKK
jgi:hypothetical protein